MRSDAVLHMRKIYNLPENNGKISMAFDNMEQSRNDYYLSIRDDILYTIQGEE